MIKQRTNEVEKKKVFYNKYKKLEELFAWAYFYQVNKRDKEYTQAQGQIEQLRKEIFNN